MPSILDTLHNPLVIMEFHERPVCVCRRFFVLISLRWSFDGQDQQSLSISKRQNSALVFTPVLSNYTIQICMIWIMRTVCQLWSRSRHCINPFAQCHCLSLHDMCTRRVLFCINWWATAALYPRVASSSRTTKRPYALKGPELPWRGFVNLRNESN